jgi:nitrate reductase gamma subunit
MASADLLLFVVLPYAAIVTAIGMAVERYRHHGFWLSSWSSQFLENRVHYWALVPFHAGILLVLLGHIVTVFIPSGILAWNGVPARLLILQSVALAGGLLAFGGLTAALIRRVTVPVLRQSTSVFDWGVYGLLLAQIATGLAVAVLYPWGTSWFAATAVPYLRSIFTLQPDASVIALMPAIVKWHVVLAWLFVGVFSLSRLVHVLAVPNQYLWRAPQVVRWVRR